MISALKIMERAELTMHSKHQVMKENKDYDKSTIEKNSETQLGFFGRMKSIGEPSDRLSNNGRVQWRWHLLPSLTT